MRRIARWIGTAARARRRLRTPPRLLTYTVTFACNARCVMCDSWRKPADGDLTTAEIARIFAQLPTLDAVRLTGGEPFVRKDLVEIAALARRHLRPLQLHVTTNGFLTERIVGFCERRPRDLPLHVLVSIDAVGAEHDRIRGHRRAYELAMQTVRALAPRQRELRMRLAVNQTVVDAGGLDEYRRLRDVLEPLGVGHHVVMAYEASATYSVREQVDLAPAEVGQFAPHGAFTTAQLVGLFDAIDADLRRLPFAQRVAKSYYLRGIRSRLVDGVGAPNPPCVALSAHLRIFPDGSVPTCQFNSRTVGNLRDTPFATLWNGALARGQRDWVAACPGCWAECEVLPNAIYTGDLVRALWAPNRRARPTAVPTTARTGA